MSLPFTGKNALITGGAVGIGQDIAFRLAQDGADVVIHYGNEEREKEQAESLARTIGTGMKRRASTLFGDFSSPQTAIFVAQQALEMLGSLDIVVNNAGITLDHPLEKVTLAQVDLLYSVNVMAPLFITQTVAKPMKLRGGGSIINISSIHSMGGIPGHAVYAGTKGAINAMTRALAIELARDHIRVNAVSPGGIEVRRQYEVNPNHSPEEFGKLVPLGRIGAGVDVAGTVAFLASDDALYITGQIICVDGGATAVPGLGNLHAREPDTPLERQPYINKIN